MKLCNPPKPNVVQTTGNSEVNLFQLSVQLEDPHSTLHAWRGQRQSLNTCELTVCICWRDTASFLNDWISVLHAD